MRDTSLTNEYNSIVLEATQTFFALEVTVPADWHLHESHGHLQLEPKAQAADENGGGAASVAVAAHTKNGISLPSLAQSLVTERFGVEANPPRFTSIGPFHAEEWIWANSTRKVTSWFFVFSSTLYEVQLTERLCGAENDEAARAQALLVCQSVRPAGPDRRAPAP